MSEIVKAGAANEPGPLLRLSLPKGPVGAVVLVLPGGRANSMAPARWWHLSSLRMRPFTARLSRAGKSRSIAVAQLQYGVRGWNGAARSPVTDARWALSILRERFPSAPVGVLGHSMGGRTAAVVASDANVRMTAALAPWWPGEEADTFEPGHQLLAAHGVEDRWTDPRASRSAVERARSRGVDAQWVEMEGGHFMLRRPGAWHELAVDFMIPNMTNRART